MNECVSGHNFQETVDFCRCKFTEPLTDEIYKLQVENKQLRNILRDCMKYVDVDNLTMQVKWREWNQTLKENDAKP